MNEEAEDLQVTCPVSTAMPKAQDLGMQPRVSNRIQTCSLLSHLLCLCLPNTAIGKKTYKVYEKQL